MHSCNIRSFLYFDTVQLFSGILDESHIFELSKRITSESDLMNLGIKGLKLRKNLIEAALYRHPKDIQDAAHDVLSEWMKRQPNVVDSYCTLLQYLRQCQMNQLAAYLRQLVEGTVGDDNGLFQSKLSLFF